VKCRNAALVAGAVMGSAAAVQQALTVVIVGVFRHPDCSSMWTVIRWGREMLDKLVGSGRPNALAAGGRSAAQTALMIFPQACSVVR
jgi:hypothetical protein